MPTTQDNKTINCELRLGEGGHGNICIVYILSKTENLFSPFGYRKTLYIRTHTPVSIIIGLAVLFK